MKMVKLVIVAINTYKPPKCFSNLAFKKFSASPPTTWYRPVKLAPKPRSQD